MHSITRQHRSGEKHGLRPASPARFRSKWYRITDPQKQEEIYKDIAKLPAKPYPAVEGIKTAMQIYDSHEMRSHKDEDFYDSSFMTALDASGFIDNLYKGTNVSGK